MTRADLCRLLDDVRFVELSHHPDMREPWSLGLRLGDDHRITWLHGRERNDIVLKAQLAIELLGRTE